MCTVERRGGVVEGGNVVMTDPCPSYPAEDTAGENHRLRLSPQEIEEWLRESDPCRLEELWQDADRCRRDHVGDEVHLRGLVEISNHCVRRCGYCGLWAGNRGIDRYRMTADEILACARDALEFGYGTVVLQAGEDPGLEAEWVAALVRRIKRETGLAVTLSLGERGEDELRLWRRAGADRYLLRFETSDPQLYAAIHPPRRQGARSEPGDRLALLHLLHRMGFEIGSGVMVGIPGQSIGTLVKDIELFGRLDLDMIGVGPYIPHPATPLGRTSGGDGCGDQDSAPGHAASGAAVRSRSATSRTKLTPDDQVANDELTVLKTIALTRLVCPEANIPSTTALATINKEFGRELGLQRGANIVMPNLTPPRYRMKYEIYPDKACVNETARACRSCLAHRLETIGRYAGSGSGGRRRMPQGSESPRAG